VADQPDRGRVPVHPHADLAVAINPQCGAGPSRTDLPAAAPAAATRSRSTLRGCGDGSGCGGRRPPSRSHRSILALSSASVSTSGTGTRWLRRTNRSGPQRRLFSWAPRMPGWQ
jgi:hypothetical protein